MDDQVTVGLLFPTNIRWCLTRCGERPRWHLPKDIIEALRNRTVQPSQPEEDRQ